MWIIPGRATRVRARHAHVSESVTVPYFARVLVAIPDTRGTVSVALGLKVRIV